MAKTNWEAIRMESIMGSPDPVTGSIIYPSLGELAAKYEVKYGTLSQRSSKEKWKYQRREALKKTNENVQKKIEELQIGTLTEKYRQDLALIAAARDKWKQDILAGIIVVKTSELLSMLKYEGEIYRAIYGVKKEPDRIIRLDIGKLDDSDRANYIRTAKRFIRNEIELIALQSAAG